MTVPSAVSRNDYVGNGATAIYDYGFRIFAATHLKVTTADLLGIETELVYPTDYSVSGVGSYSGGTITLTAGNLTTGYALTIRLFVPLLQQTDLRNQGGYLPETVEDALDYLDMICLQQQDENDRTLVQPETEAGTGLTLPTIVDRALLFLGFDAAGDPIAASAVSGALATAFAATLLDDADGDAFVATLMASADQDTTWAALMSGLDLEAARILLEVDENTHIHVRNVSGSTITAGTPVYAAGYNAGQDTVEVEPADANDAAKMPSIGIVEEAISNNTNGVIIVNGRVQNIDTSAWSVTDALYISETAGELTNIRPTDNASKVQKIAVVLRSHATQGRILVQGPGRTNDVPNGLGQAMRQTVLAGAVDSSGFADFISAGTGLAASIAATTTPVVSNFAAGFGDLGPVDYQERITADDADCWSGLTDEAENYLYRENGVGYGNTINLPPVYGPTYLKAGGVGRAYSSFDGADAATAFTDANGNAWTFNGDAQLDTADKKFGTASLLLDGTGDYLNAADWAVHAGENEGGCEWTLWFNVDDLSTSRTLISTLSNYKYFLYVNSSGYLSLALSSNGSSWNVVNATSTTTVVSTGGWYRVRLVWDGATYKVYLSDNGAAETEEISATSSTAFTGDNPQIGRYTTLNLFDGHIDDFSFSVGPQTLGTETPPAGARGGLPVDDEHWFDTTRMVMQYWDYGTLAWVDTKRVFMGEATTTGAAVSSAVTYALRGETQIGAFVIAAATEYVKTHNLGFINYKTKSYGRPAGGPWDEWASANNDGSLTLKKRNSIRLSVHTSPTIVDAVDSTSTPIEAMIEMSRGW